MQYIYNLFCDWKWYTQISQFKLKKIQMQQYDYTLTKIAFTTEQLYYVYIFDIFVYYWICRVLRYWPTTIEMKFVTTIDLLSWLKTYGVFLFRHCVKYRPLWIGLKLYSLVIKLILFSFLSSFCLSFMCIIHTYSMCEFDLLSIYSIHAFRIEALSALCSY